VSFNLYSNVLSLACNKNEVCGKKVAVLHGGTIKKERLINVTRCRVAGSDVSVAIAAILHRETEDWVLRMKFGLVG
jgi:hypothetical protein